MTNKGGTTQEGGHSRARKSIAVLISGSGTTLRNLLGWRANQRLIPNIIAVISSNPSAPGRRYADEAGIPVKVVDWRSFRDVELFSAEIFDHCRQLAIDWVVLGGFLKRLTIPPDFVHRVVNIHPSLIPAFCGQGYYGSKVHRAVLDYGCKLSGCTVHFVDDLYDHGPIIAQVSVPVEPDDTVESLAARVFVQECELYPRVLNQLALECIRVEGRHTVITNLP